MKTERIEVGCFEVKSEDIVVSDPCYSKGGFGYNQIPALQGVWRAYIEDADCGEWGHRVGRLVAYHEGYDADEELSIDDELECGVDSGQMSIFDSAEYECDDDFYTDIIDYRGAHGYEPKALIWRNAGVVSDTGYGDGCYAAWVSETSEGLACRVEIQFIGGEGEE